jgi:hypothetical protein
VPFSKLIAWFTFAIASGFVLSVTALSHPMKDGGAPVAEQIASRR